MLKTCKGKTVVIKYGGAAMQSEELKAGVMEDVAMLAEDADVILVHGGGPELSALQKKLGSEPLFVDGLRYTDEETIDAALMALCGKVNKELVRLLENLGRKAVGLSGIDGGTLRCVKQREPDIGFVGKITDVDTGLLLTLLGAGYTPVVSTVGLGDDEHAYNINADTAAGKIAAAVKADLYITLTDVPGVLKDADLIAEIKTGEVEELIAKGVITGGMIPKACGIADIVTKGAGSAYIIDGRVPHALHAFMNGEMTGTRFTNG